MVRGRVVCIFRSLLRTFCDVRGFPQAEFGRKQKVVGSKAEHWSTPQLGAIARSARCTARAARGEHVRRALPARARARGWRRGTRKWAAHAAQRRRARNAGTTSETSRYVSVLRPLMALQVADAALLAQEHIPPVHLQPFVLLITPTCVPQRAQAASDIAPAAGPEHDGSSR